MPAMKKGDRKGSPGYETHTGQDGSTTLIRKGSPYDELQKRLTSSGLSGRQAAGVTADQANRRAAKIYSAQKKKERKA